MEASRFFGVPQEEMEGVFGFGKNAIGGLAT